VYIRDEADDFRLQRLVVWQPGKEDCLEWEMDPYLQKLKNSQAMNWSRNHRKVLQVLIASHQEYSICFERMTVEGEDNTVDRTISQVLASQIV
jgi:hypothetical protein